MAVTVRLPCLTCFVICFLFVCQPRYRIANIDVLSHAQLYRHEPRTEAIDTNSWCQITGVEKVFKENVKLSFSDRYSCLNLSPSKFRCFHFLLGFILIKVKDCLVWILNIVQEKEWLPAISSILCLNYSWLENSRKHPPSVLVKGWRKLVLPESLFLNFAQNDSNTDNIFLQSRDQFNRGQYTFPCAVTDSNGKLKQRHQRKTDCNNYKYWGKQLDMTCSQPT